jgi:hypothetical protein
MNLIGRLVAAVTFLVAPLCFAQVGAVVFVRNGDVWIMKTDGSQQIRLTSSRQASVPRLFFVERSELYRLTITPPSSPTLIPNTTGVLEYDVKPDGTKLVLTYHSNSNYDLYTMNVDGSGKTAINSVSGVHQLYPRWGRDGYIYFGQSNVGNAFTQKIYRIPQNGVNNAILLVNEFSQFPVEGGIASRVAYLHRIPDAERTIRLMNSDGTGQVDVPGAPGAFNIRWGMTTIKRLYISSELTEISGASIPTALVSYFSRARWMRVVQWGSGTAKAGSATVSRRKHLRTQCHRQTQQAGTKVL